MKPKCNNCEHCFTIEGETWCGKKLQYCDKNGSCNSYKPNVNIADYVWLLVAIVAVIILVQYILM